MIMNVNTIERGKPFATVFSNCSKAKPTETITLVLARTARALATASGVAIYGKRAQNPPGSLQG